MSNELTPTSGFSSLVPVTDRERLQTMKELICKNANNAQLEFFYHYCIARGFDPFAREAFLIVRESKDGSQMAIQTSIDAMRSRAEANGDIWNPGEFTYEEKNGQLISATCTVYRRFDGEWKAYQGVARWSEFYPGDAQGFMWKKMPYNQLGKCAEAQALRRAAPKQLGQLYAKEELELVDITPAKSDAEKLSGKSAQDALLLAAEKLPEPQNGPQHQPGKVEAPIGDKIQKAHPETVKLLLSEFHKLGVSTDEVLAEIMAKSTEDITTKDIETLRESFRVRKAAKK